MALGEDSEVSGVGPHSVRCCRSTEGSAGQPRPAWEAPLELLTTELGSAVELGSAWLQDHWVCL
jgi:hypothetical protein